MRITRQKDIFANTNRHYSLRKLSVGLASVLIGLSFASATKTQTVKADSLNKVPVYLRGNENTVRNEIRQFSSVQNSVAEPQKNLLENTENNQTEAKNQENRLADQSNNKLINQDSTNSNQDSGQNLTDPDEAKQDAVTKNDAEKGIIGSGSLQDPDNHAGNSSQTQPQNSKKLDLTKNSKKFAKKVLATNLIATSPITNGGFDEATWGKLDVNDWQGSAQDGVYQLTHYSGDLSHVIVPNEADFEKAGKSTNGLQVGISSDTIKSFFTNLDKTFAFSKTNSQKVKAIGADWSETFAYRFTLSKFDGSNLDVSNVTNMRSMFSDSKISNLNSLTNWDTSKVTDMRGMFSYNSISDLTPLAHWDTSKVTDMNGMFFSNQISDLTPLTYWDTSNVTDMRGMFGSSMFGGGFNHNSISDLAPLANWNTGNVTDMSDMFLYNRNISDLTPLANWKTSNVTDMSSMFRFNKISDLSPLTNWDVSKVTNMGGMFGGNSISNLVPLAHWDTSKVTDMRMMFTGNSISDLTPLANWKTSKVTNMNSMFAQNPDIKDLKPVANRDVRSVAIKDLDGIFSGDTQLDLTDINNTQFMQDFLKLKDTLKDTYPLRKVLSNLLQGTTFITNNADLVKLLVGQDLPTFTKTAKRTIVFHFPDGTQKEIDQIINFKTIAPVQIEWPAPTDVRIEAMVLAFASERQPFASERQPFASERQPFVSERPPFVSERPPFVSERPPFASVRPPFASVRQPVQSDGPRIIKTYPVKESDWQLDTSKPNDDVIIDGVICFKPVQIPRIDGYKAYLMKDPVNPAMFLVSFVALPQQLQNNQLNNVQLPQKPAQPEQKQPEQKQPEQKQPEQKQPEQKQPEQTQPEQKQPEQKQSEQKQSVQKPAQPIQARPANDKQADQAINHISYTLMHNDSTFDDVNSFEPVQNDSASFEDDFDSTQKDDAAKTQKVNTAKHKKHIVKKRTVKHRRKHAKKYRLKRRLRKHTKRSRKHTKRVKHAKKRIIKHRKRASRKFRKYHLKHIKKA